ncbi:hypothetical protein ADUPG1_007056 [Aduncisulcus paluster]|uniref:Uncharacterized protein n=1 Tax=Aduncisulcus paluster TaxID=2918883 RepID=A0ABQ5KM71_9EUKA|nr:hypothetical protein ADUPG1_007056 [Aduncisulcus paluster]
MLTVSSVYGSSSSSSSSSGIYSSSSASASIVESLRQKYQAKLESVIVNLNHVVAENKVLLEQVATLRATVDGQQSDIIKKLDALSVANMSEVKHVLKSEEEKHDSHAQLRESLAEMQVLRSKLKQTEEELIALKVAHSKEGVDSGDKTRGQGFDYSGSLSSSLSPSASMKPSKFAMSELKRERAKSFELEKKVAELEHKLKKEFERTLDGTSIEASDREILNMQKEKLIFKRKLSKKEDRIKELDQLITTFGFYLHQVFAFIHQRKLDTTGMPAPPETIQSWLE